MEYLEWCAIMAESKDILIETANFLDFVKFK